MKINHCIVVILLLLSLLMWSGCKDNNNIEDIDFSCSIITNDCDNFNANIYLRDLSWENLNESDIKFIVESCAEDVEGLIVSETNKKDSDEALYVINGIDAQTNEVVFSYDKQKSVIVFGERTIAYKR
ncbi:MAG: hypothetical protein Q4A65_02860 [Bacillota bacterium]|nr:hypothetical protein [Bacillota bacterium]